MSSCNQQECEFAPKGDAFNALDEILHDLWHGTDPSLAGIESSELQSARKELADLRASVLPQAIVEAVKAYQESYLTLQGLKGVDEKRKIEWQRSKGYNEIGTKRALFRAIEADAKGST